MEPGTHRGPPAGRDIRQEHTAGVRVERTVEIAAPPEAVWEVLGDVERWPTWTASMQSVRILGGGPLGLGSVVEVKQPRLPKALWNVSEFTPGRSFSWTASGPGVRSVGEHRVTPSGTGSTVLLGFAQAGPLGALAGLLLGRLIRSYVDREATGLKTRCEAA